MRPGLILGIGMGDGIGSPGCTGRFPPGTPVSTDSKDQSVPTGEVFASYNFYFVFETKTYIHKCLKTSDLHHEKKILLWGVYLH